MILAVAALYLLPCATAMLLAPHAEARAARRILLYGGGAMLLLNAAAVGGAALFDGACGGNMLYGYEDCAAAILQAVRRPAAAFILVWLVVGAVAVGLALLLAAAIAEAVARRRAG
ncbi:hypothetical protein JQC91_11800 [Jannaschia sp. Os4]|uniref:hypothetical protein n=1 Tax=Jannaschia sp. Os4 TaxID=2807617 RepID=UPI00193AAE9C|nr:hypothetical protein [Jannaschia sp. Os4]MBM2576982.1 hypothetical protein [Jannaschia sp. Os4]